MRRGTLARHLLAWALGALCVVWGGFMAIGYTTGQHEADELTDGHLASVTALLLAYREGSFVRAPVPGAAPAIGELKAHDYQQSMSVVVWNAAGQVLGSYGRAQPPFATPEGFVTLTLGAPAAQWRAFSRWNDDHSRRAMVLLSVPERDALADDIAGQVTEPGLWLLPVVALALGLALHRGLLPLHQLSREILRLDIHRPLPLSAHARPQELRAAVDAINSLVDRYQAALARERVLADEFAHELRTPLAALSLQARALRGEAPGLLEPALARLEREALRAGHVVDQLLALARASRTELDAGAAPVDLDALARQTAAELVPLAHSRQHALGVSGQGPLLLRGHDTLLSLALRNLVENAIAHTPAGTRIELQVDGAQRWLQVSDNAGGNRADMPAPAPPAQEPAALRLGLGHRVVEKVASLHGARFGEVPAPPGFSRCYRLSFGPLGAAPAATP